MNRYGYGYGYNNNNNSVFYVWIPFGDHPLKLERYRED